MNIDVLLSTMNQDLDIIQRCNIKSSATIINQCDTDSILKIDSGRILWINSTSRGLSKSRNIAISNSTGDICLLCDDDVVYYDDYEKIVLDAFSIIPNADVIIFDIDELNVENPRKKITKIKKMPPFKTYGSVHVAFKRESFIKHDIKFNELFGSGSNMYSMAEDALLFRTFKKERMKVFLFPATISKVSFATSSWFNGYDEKFFYDIGAFLYTAYPFLCFLLKWYYPITLSKKTELQFFSIIKWINNGIYGCKHCKSFSAYIKNGNARK